MKELIESLIKFRNDRDWDQFHTPKNLSIALTVEVSELLELFQWMTDEEIANLSPERKDKVTEELGDIMIYLTYLCDRFDIDPITAAKQKMAINAQKYPIELSKGNAQKYNDRK